VNIDSAALTDRGRSRTHNEDAVLAEEAPCVGLLLAVADGVGGLRDGAGASAEVIARLREAAHAAAPGELFDGACEAVMHANDEIFNRARHRAAGLSGTTIVAAVFAGNDLRLLHAGDSRAYLFRDGGLRRLTEDHSVVADHLRAGLLTEDEAAVSPRRHVITRAVGTEATLALAISDAVVLLPGDVVLLSTDGLHGVVPEEEIAAILDSGISASQLAQSLIDRANALGGPDNVSVAVARIQIPRPEVLSGA
jgi:protein phosphatase